VIGDHRSGVVGDLDRGAEDFCGLVGSDSSAAKIKAPASLVLKNCRRRGNLNAWKENVAGPAGNSSRLVALTGSTSLVSGRAYGLAAKAIQIAR
jgi:hypothetical protein